MNLFDNEELKKELIQAYYDARKNKRNTLNALKFEINLEHNIIELYKEICEYRYQLSHSICFIVEEPVKREIFAAHFRDRIVHHFVINKINSIFEKQFIHDSYSCRVGKGTLFGIKRVARFIRRSTQNFSRDSYILKLDIEGFFMHINRKLLYKKIENLLSEKYHEKDKNLLLYLIKTIILNDPTQNCIIKGKSSNWHGLPRSKSLFHTPPDCGLPIGNLTSQIFANFYLNDFDHFITNTLKMKFYGRYVDDFVIVHHNKVYLRSLISIIAEYLHTNLGLTLHPRKIYFQHYTKGVEFLGAVILPHRLYVANRTKGNFFRAIRFQNQLIEEHEPTKEEQDAFVSNLNSYLGIMQHYKTNRIKAKGIEKHLSPRWLNYVFPACNFDKFVK